MLPNQTIYHWAVAAVVIADAAAVVALGVGCCC